jgi:hypothetical protein
MNHVGYAVKKVVIYHPVFVCRYSFTFRFGMCPDVWSVVFRSQLSVREGQESLFRHPFWFLVPVPQFTDGSNAQQRSAHSKSVRDSFWTGL